MQPEMQEKTVWGMRYETIFAAAQETQLKYFIIVMKKIALIKILLI